MLFGFTSFILQAVCASQFYYRNVLSTASPAHSWCCTWVTPGQDDCFWDSGITLRKALDSKVEADQEAYVLLLTPALPVKLHVVLRLEAHFQFKWVTAWSVVYFPQQDGLVGKVICCQAWWLSEISRTCIMEGRRELAPSCPSHRHTHIWARAHTHTHTN